MKDIGRRLPLQLQCSYQGQQGDVRQSVRGKYIAFSIGGTCCFDRFSVPNVLILGALKSGYPLSLMLRRSNSDNLLDMVPGIFFFSLKGKYAQRGVSVPWYDALKKKMAIVPIRELLRCRVVGLHSWKTHADTVNICYVS